MKNTEMWMKNGLTALKEEFSEEKVLKAVEQIKKFQVEIPSWALGPFGGGRFGGYTPPGGARNINEKIEDIAFIHKLTGAAGKIATHVLWDFSPDEMQGDIKIARKINEEIRSQGLSMGAIHPTYFLKGSQSGSFTAPDKNTRQRYIRQTVLAGEIASQLGNKTICLWFPDGSLYPGQIEIQENYRVLKESLIESYQQLPDDIRIFLEYKVFEPGTYSTTIPDWGTSFLLSKSLGDNAGVLIDLGHHHHGTNIEQIVARLIEEKMNCCLHFNTRYAADDDHAVEPNAETARIFYQLVKGKVLPDSGPRSWSYIIDQCSGRENRILALIHTIDSLQLSLAKGMIVDTTRLKEAQRKDSIIEANEIFNDAVLCADVRPIVAKARMEKDLPLDPIAAYIESGHQKKIEIERNQN
jgi:L-rhamnose isomerase / sugar isomerase